MLHNFYIPITTLDREYYKEQNRNVLKELTSNGDSHTIKKKKAIQCKLKVMNNAVKKKDTAVQSLMRSNGFSPQE